MSSTLQRSRVRQSKEDKKAEATTSVKPKKATKSRVKSASKRRRWQAPVTVEEKQDDLAEILLKIKDPKFAAHRYSNIELEIEYKTNLKTGLTQEEARKRYRRKNKVPEGTENDYLQIFRNLIGLPQLLLWGSGVGAIFIYLFQKSLYPDFTYETLYLGISILATAAFLTLYGLFHEIICWVSYKLLRKKVVMDAKVLRNSEYIIIPVEALVVGDVVQLESGNIIPADIRIFEATNFRVDTSLITCEPSNAIREATYQTDDCFKAENLAFFKSEVLEGYATGVVIATGKRTVIGRLRAAQRQKKRKVFLSKIELRKFMIGIMIVGICIGGVYCFLGFFVSPIWVAPLFYIVGMFIAFIPEGMFVIFTVGMSLGLIKLFTVKKFYIKNINMFELIGGLSVIIFDKTGTITKNNMKVSKVYYDMKIRDENDAFDKNWDDLNPLIRAASICLRADFVTTPKIKLPYREVVGDASERAILQYMEKNFEASTLRIINGKVFEIPFNSELKYQLSIHYIPSLDIHLCVMKGAPEIILLKCDTIRYKGKNEQLSQYSSEIRDTCARLTKSGYRVIGFSDCYLPNHKYNSSYKFSTDPYNFPNYNYRFLGFMALSDPVKDNAHKTVQDLQKLGIKVILVTGDHPLTAQKVAKQNGFVSSCVKTNYDSALENNVNIRNVSINPDTYTSIILTGDHLRRMKAKELDEIIYNTEDVAFARLSSTEKVAVVQSYQRQGHVVGYVGDGANDILAMKKADISMAMGIAGVDAAKQAADIVIIKDDISTVAAAVVESRILFENLKKCLAYAMSATIMKMCPLVLQIILGIPAPLSYAYLLYTNIITDFWPILSLIYERSEAGSVPRNMQRDRLITFNLLYISIFVIGLLQTSAAVINYFFIYYAFGILPKDILMTYGRISTPYYSQTNFAFEDMYEEDLAPDHRKYLDQVAQTGFFIGIFITQGADLLICKTRRSSLITHGFGNICLNIALGFSIFVCFILVIVPPFHDIFYTTPIHTIYFIIPTIYAILIILVDELRRLIIRRYPDSNFVQTLLYW